MPRVNQGIFKKILNEHKAIIDECDNILKSYFTDGWWNNDYDFFDFMHDASDTFEKANNLCYEISNLLKSLKFEEKEKMKKKYSGLITGMESVKYELCSHFKNVYDVIKETFSFKEQGYMNDFALYHYYLQNY